MAEPKEKLTNQKVLTVEEKGSFFSKKNNKDMKQYSIVLQGADDLTKVITGIGNEPLPENVAVGQTVEDVWVYEDTYNDKVTTKFFFPQKKEGGGKGSYSGKGSYQKESEESKITGVTAGISKDIMLAQPGEFKWEDWYERWEATAVTAWQIKKHLESL